MKAPATSPGLFIWNLGVSRNIPENSGMFRVPENWQIGTVKNSRPAIEQTLQQC
jgi:hypothetical protein